MDFLTKTSKSILSGTGYITSFAKELLTKKINYSDIISTPTASASTEMPKYTATGVPDEFKPAFEKAYELYSKDVPRGLLETVAMMESSMGADKTNETADLGKYGWLTGLTKTGHAAEILKNKDIPYAIYGKDKEGNPHYKGLDTVETPEDALGLTASSLAVLKRNNPQMSDEDLYFKLYNANEKVDTPKRREVFRENYKQYSQL